MMSSAPTSWRSKKQTSVALSAAEAEYIALSGVTQEAMWLRQLISELNHLEVTVIYEDNQSAISMSQNAQFHGRAKHIDIQHHFVREQVSAGTIELKYCPSGLMVADMLTKGLSCGTFELLRKMAEIVPLPISDSRASEKECLFRLILSFLEQCTLRT